VTLAVVLELIEGSDGKATIESFTLGMSEGRKKKSADEGSATNTIRELMYVAL